MSKLVLIDRDGVINEEVKDSYVESPRELLIYPRAIEALTLFRQHDYTCVVVTNQSVVARGRITDKQLEDIHQHLMEVVRSGGGDIAQVISCMDHPDNPTFRRKPGPGMLLEAIEKYSAARTPIVPMIGDSLVDMQAAHSAGCARYLVMTGKGKLTHSQLEEKLYPVTVCEDILDAALKITRLPA